MVNFLFGSGIHGGQLPNVKYLTDNILKLNKSTEEQARFNSSILIPKVEKTKYKNRIRFLNILYGKIKIFYEGLKITPNYEDVLYLIRQFLDNVSGRKYNPVFDEFKKSILKEYGCNEEEIDSRRFVPLIQELDIEDLEGEIKSILKLLLDVSGEYNFDTLKLFEDVASYSKSNNETEINIFTLNHDNAFENFFVKINLQEQLNDGFQRPNNWYDKPLWDLNNFKNNLLINLYKLHGSINWYYLDDQKFYYDINRAVYKEVTEGLANPNDMCILVGTYNKYEAYLEGIFYDLLSSFNEKLKYSNKLIISGYGFQDNGINIFLDRWLKENGDNFFIIIHPEGEGMIEKEFKETFLYNKYYDDKDRFKFISKEFENTSWNDILKFL